MKLANPPKGEMALAVSSKTSLDWPKREVISVRVVLCGAGLGCLSINPYAHNPLRKATLFSLRRSGSGRFGIRSMASNIARTP